MKKTKILFISNTANFSKFNRPFMRWFRERNWQVDYASAGEEEILDCDNQYKISITRTPFNIKNIKAYKDLKNIIMKNNYNIIHCHTPMGGFLGRMVAKNIKIKTKVIYTAHGFHFYKGAPIFNWLVYYPIEKYLAKYTDILVTINEEDYRIAKQNYSQCKNINKIDGIGVDLSKFFPHTENEKKRLRSELGYYEDDFIITNIAEINRNKNQIMLIKNLPRLIKNISNLRILFIGNNNYSTIRNKLELFIKKYKIQKYISFLGYRNDVDKLISISDIAFSASIREGLPINIIEAMACGIPIVCSKNRGHNSLIVDGKSGLLFSNASEMADNILKIYNSQSFAELLGKNAIEDSKKYNKDIIIKKMAEIYKQCF
jgi:glycosyltransferase EpsD